MGPILSKTGTLKTTKETDKNKTMTKKKKKKHRWEQKTCTDQYAVWKCLDTITSIKIALNVVLMVDTLTKVSL